MAEVDPYARAIGERIKQARMEVEGGPLKQEELADLIHVSKRSMSAYEVGEVIPYFKMKDLAAVLNRPVAWLLHGEQSQENPGELKPILEQISRQLGDILDHLVEKEAVAS